MPVIDGVSAAVKLAEALVGSCCRTSKAGGWAAPRHKPDGTGFGVESLVG